MPALIPMSAISRFRRFSCGRSGISIAEFFGNACQLLQAAVVFRFIIVIGRRSLRFCFARLYMRKFRFTRNILCTFVLALRCAAQEHLLQHNWDYGGVPGPSHWGDLEPEFATCKSGHRQSPIDIRNPKKAALPPIQFEYKPSPLDIIDNGHTIQVNYNPASFRSPTRNTHSSNSIFTGPARKRSMARAST